MNYIKLKDDSSIKELLDSQSKTLKDLVRYARKAGAIKGIPDPVEWQKAQRITSDPRQERTKGVTER